MAARNASSVSRRQALAALAAGVAAGSPGCAILLGGASHPEHTPPPGAISRGVLSVALAEVPELATGRAVLVEPGEPHPELLLVALDGDGYAAVTSECTHRGCTVGWDAARREWPCPCHGSRFALDGSVVSGPARRPLRRLPVHRQGGTLLVELAAEPSAGT